MGVQLTVKGADFSISPIGFAAPVSSGLEFWNYFGGTAAKTVRNLAVGKAAPSVVGTPVISTGFATFASLANYLQTGVLDQAEVTLLAVSRAPNLQANTFGDTITTRNGNGAAAGSGLRYNYAAVGSSKGIVTASRNSSGTDAELTGVLSTDPQNNWGFYAARIGAAYHRLDNRTTGQTISGSVANPRSTPNGLAYRIGSAYVNNSIAAPVDVAFAAIYSRCLTDAEITAIYAKVQSYLASLSITI